MTEEKMSKSRLFLESLFAESRIHDKRRKLLIEANQKVKTIISPEEKATSLLKDFFNEVGIKYKIIEKGFELPDEPVTEELEVIFDDLHDLKIGRKVRAYNNKGIEVRV